jgi:hypothetical protein
VRDTKKVIKENTPPPVSKLPLTLDLLKRVAKNAPDTFRGLRDKFMMVLMTAALLRGAEAMSLDRKDVFPEVIVDANGKQRCILWVIIESPTKANRNATARETVVVGIAVDPAVCPIKLWGEYMAALEKKYPNGKCLFPNPSNGGKRMVSTTPCGIVQKALARLHDPLIDSSLYGGHSCRRGGATEAARKAVNMRLLKRHGRWKSDAVYLYIDDCLMDKLTVSEAILGFGNHR